MTSHASKNRAQSGFSLAEVMVATAIFAIIVIAALLIYDRSNQVFRQSMESGDMQQNTRVAYDKLVADVRMTGFDYKRTGKQPGGGPSIWAPSRDYIVGTIVTPIAPNGRFYRATSGGQSGGGEPVWPIVAGGSISEGVGRPTWVEAGPVAYEQPDEQIEYAGVSALTIRGNFDFEAGEVGDVENGREPNLELSSNNRFPVVTTENNEIVTYALVSANSAANTDTLSFFADVNLGGTPSRRAFPSGTAERQIDIAGVDLCDDTPLTPRCTNPPYTLFRFTLNDAGGVERTPVAENIRSLRFEYFEDTSGQQALRDNAATPALAPNIGGVGAYNPATPVAAVDGRIIRSKIQAINVRLIGMNAQEAEPNWVDTTDTISPRTRKFAVESLIIPRNLGRFGLREGQGRPPGAPTLTSLCFGYCGIVIVSWNAGPDSEDATYSVVYDTDAAGSFSSGLPAGQATSYAVDLTSANLTPTYFFKVRATNTAGSAISVTPLSASAQNVTKPQAPTAGGASGGPNGSDPAAVAGRVNLRWNFNASASPASGAPTCSTGTPPTQSLPGEVAGFRIFRSTDPAFTPDPAVNLIYNQNGGGSAAAAGAIPPTPDASGNYSWSDPSVSNCITYYYKIQTAEHCAVAAAFNNPADVDTALSAFTANIQGRAATGTAPLAPTDLALEQVTTDPGEFSTRSYCDSATNRCVVRMNWRKVTPAVDRYKIFRQQRLGGVDVGSPVEQELTGALASFPTGPNVTWADDNLSRPVEFRDLATSIAYEYRYTIVAAECLDSPPSAPRTFPPPCSFSGSITIQSGATSGSGVGGDPWVMNAGDTITVNPPPASPPSGQLNQVILDVYLGGALVSTYPTDTSTPFEFAWVDRQEGATYRLVFTITNNAGCTENVERYVQDEIPTGCTFQFDAPTARIVAQASPTSLAIGIRNTSTDTLFLETLTIQYLLPDTTYSWTSLAAPSGGLLTFSPARSTSGTAILDMNPLTAATTGAFTSGDVIFGPSEASIFILNFVRSAGTVPLTVAAIQKVCVTFSKGPGRVTSTSILTTGSSCNPAPGVVFSGGGGSGAAATTTRSGNALATITLTSGGSGYTSYPTLALTGGCTATAIVNGVTGVNGTFSCRILNTTGGPVASPNNPTTCD